MFIKKKKSKSFILALFFIMLSFFVFSPVWIASVVFPETIHLIEGKEQVFEFNIPVVATFKPERAEAFTINDKPAESASVNLGERLSVVSNQTGSTEVKLSVFGVLPVKKITVSTMPDIDVVPSGAAVGVRINTDGIMVLGTAPVKGERGGETEPAKNILKSGDLILSANGESIENKEQLKKIIEESGGNEIGFRLKRNGEVLEASASAVKSEGDGAYKMGIWARDSTQGIGTVTYYKPDSLKFGALGHGIMDVDTKRLMTIKNGLIMRSSITSSKRGKKGSPGELLGNIENTHAVGKIEANTPFGIYGYVDADKKEIFGGETMKIGLQNDVKAGAAYILSTIDGETPKKYEVMIESVNKYSGDSSKGMIIKITDEHLLSKTNGIVQGMSGSPIIQDGKLIGAVTHVFVQEPSKGYGIFIENMFKQDEQI